MVAHSILRRGSRAALNSIARQYSSVPNVMVRNVFRSFFSVRTSFASLRYARMIKKRISLTFFPSPPRDLFFFVLRALAVSSSSRSLSRSRSFRRCRCSSPSSSFFLSLFRSFVRKEERRVEENGDFSPSLSLSLRSRVSSHQTNKRTHKRTETHQNFSSL